MLKCMFFGEAVVLVLTSPNFVQKVLSRILKSAGFEWNKYKNKRKFYNFKFLIIADVVLR